MENLQKYYDLVENCISALGIELQTARIPDREGEWELTKGSATIWVLVQYLEQNKAAYVQVLAPIVSIPEHNLEKFYEELLEVNHTFYGVAFTKFKQWIYVKSIREAEGIDQNELFNMITRVGNYADMYDDVFSTKFGAKPIL